MAHVDEKLSTIAAAATRAHAATPERAHPLRRLAGWLSFLRDDGGMGDRFAAERGRDEGLVSRVEGSRRH
jgi:hypothetical protein